MEYVESAWRGSGAVPSRQTPVAHDLLTSAPHAPPIWSSAFDGTAVDEASKSIPAILAGSGTGNARAETEPEAAPPMFFCPVTRELMRDPVLLPSGQTFERRDIALWLLGGNYECPVTRVKLELPVSLVPNVALRQSIEHWCAKYQPESLDLSGRLLPADGTEPPDDGLLEIDCKGVTTIKNYDWEPLSPADTDHDAVLRRDNPNHILISTTASARPATEPAQRLGSNLIAALVMVLASFLCAEIAANGWQVADLNSNPHIGPDKDTMTVMGAKVTPNIYLRHEWYRVVCSAFLSAGVIHLLGSSLLLVVCGRQLMHRPCSRLMPLIFLLSAIGGTVLSNFFEPYAVTVACSAGMAGLVGAAWLDTLMHREHAGAGGLCLLVIVTAAMFAIGTMPFVGNFGHLGGLFVGAMLWLAAVSGHRCLSGDGQVARRMGLVQVAVVLCVLVLLATIAALPLLEQHYFGWRCSWCRYLSCIPNPLWICEELPFPGEAPSNGTGECVGPECAAAAKGLLQEHFA